MPERPPKAILLTVMLISLLCALSAAGGVVITGMTLARGGGNLQIWFLLAFEVIVLVAGITGVLTGRGRFTEAPALAMLCVGGSLIATGILSEPVLVQRLLGSRVHGTTVMGVSVLPVVIGRIAAGVVLMALGGLTVLVRSPGRSFGLLIRGVLFGIPVVAGLAGAAFLLSSRGRSAASGVPPVVIVVGLILGLFVLGGFLTASLHCLIGAFEVNLPDLEEDSGA